MSIDYSNAIKKREAEIAELKVKQKRADELWDRVVKPLSADDRKLLFSLLHESFHGED